MTQENIDIRVREDGSRAVRRNLEGIGTTADKSAGGVDALKFALKSLAAFLAIDKIRQYADAWAAAAGQIKIATSTTAEAAAVTEKLFRAAQDSRAPFSELVQLYSRAARAGKELGASQNQLIKFSENIGKALSVQGVSAQDAKGALLQLGQALGSGIVRAEEFNSVLEGAPYILQVVANNLKGADGSIAKLRKIMLAGELTSKAFFDAFEKGGADIAKDFAKAPLTIGQSLTVMNNALTKYIGELDTALGLSQAFGSVAKFVAQNIDLIATALFAAGAAALVVFAPGPILAFMSAIKTLFILINAHPFVALAAGIAAAAVFLYKFRDAISLGIDDVTTIGDLLRALGEIAVEAFRTLYGAAQAGFEGLGDLATSAYAAITGSTQGAAEDWRQEFGSFYADVGTGFGGVVRGIAKTLDAIGGLITGLGIGIYRVFAGLPEAVTTPFKQMYNIGAQYIEDLLNVVINGINKVRGFVGASLLETVSIAKADVDENYYKKYGAEVADSINAGFEAQGGALLQTVDGVFKRAQEIAQERKIVAGFGTGAAPDLNAKPKGGVGAGPSEKEMKALEKLKGDLRSLLDKISPVEGAILDLAKARQTLTNAQKAGLITTEQELKYATALFDEYQHLLDPLGTINKELDTQARLLGMNAQARQVEGQFLDITNRLKQDGITLSKEESLQLRNRLIDLQALTEQTAAQDSLLAQSVDTRRQYAVQLDAIQKLLADPNSGFTKGDALQAVVSQNADLLANTQAFADAQVAQYEDMYERVRLLREKNLISEEDAEIARANIAKVANQQRYQQADQFFGNLATLSQNGNKKLAEVGKAAAIAQATISGYVAIQNALAVQPYPLGIALAAGAAVAAAGNVNAILNTKGYESGGFTGQMSRKQIAGVVHGQEYVNNADSTAVNRPVLEAMNNGANWKDLAGGNRVSVEIQNYGSNKDFTVEQLTEDRVRVIARDVTKKEAPGAVADEFSNPNSRVSKSAQQNLAGGGRKR